MNSVGARDDSQRFTLWSVSKRVQLRRRIIASVCASSLFLQGCYNAIPVAGASALPRGEVTIRMNDRGRLLVGNRLGPLVDKLQGRIVRMDSLQVEMAVELAEDARGSIARWGGERFTIPREGINSMNEKQLSKKRSWLLVGAIAVGVAAFYIGGKALSLFGSNGSVDPGPDPI